MIVMASVTYLIRLIPLVLAREDITNKYIRAFLYYVPYACLAAMTFPAMILATASAVSGIAGFLVAVVAAYRGRSLLTVALSASVAVFLTERILTLCMMI